jgi:hypothetical protein
MRRLNQMFIANHEEFAAIFAEAGGDALEAPATPSSLGAAAGADPASAHMSGRLDKQFSKVGQT